MTAQVALMGAAKAWVWKSSLRLTDGGSCLQQNQAGVGVNIENRAQQSC
jgi:hypothetical protein